MNLILLLAATWFVLWGFILIVRYQQELISYWKEPVLKSPVLIFESDDWGGGPLNQTDALGRIGSILSKYSDRFGHNPVMTLGLILSVPDSKNIRRSQYKAIVEKRLDHADFSSLKKTLINGSEQGVFDLQLHGMAHYWPENLLHALLSNENIRRWLDQNDFPQTEGLPSALQTRWANTQQLPSLALTESEIDQAAGEEVRLFSEVFGFAPVVAVPPVFIWNDSVEKSWKRHSIKYLVTSGQSFDRRDKGGKPAVAKRIVFNGQLSTTGLMYLVRNDYFEPCMGHTADMAVQALELKSRLAQPTLLEIHRINFIRDDETTDKSLKELERSISLALEKYPQVRFLSSRELADKYAAGDEDLIDQSLWIRLSICLVRLWSNYAIRKWLYVSGFFIPLYGFVKFRQ